MNIFFLSPEVWPFTRVGGLAEVSHDLPLALGAKGHRVSVVTIKSRLSPDSEEGLEEAPFELEVPISWQKHKAKVFQRKFGEGVTVYLIRQDRLFDREGIYGNAYGDYEDNCERFVFFSRACLELALALDQPVDVVHANDWTNALVPVYLKTLYADKEALASTASLLTVHNLARQGIYWHYDMPLLGLGWEYFVPERLEFFGKLNILKGGLIFADLISTVSPTYAKEMLSPERGEGLEGVLAERGDRISGALNGIDTKAWDPCCDPALAAHFGPDDLSGKKVCSRDLRIAFGLPEDSERPLVTVIGRLEDRKGLDLITSGLEAMVEMGFDLIVMGYGGDHYHSTLLAAANRHPEYVSVLIGHDMGLDHKLMAGAELLLMPSRFEPCGLHQMHAMRYGTVPVVRATGGLRDTVTDHRPDRPGVGFNFTEYSTEGMLGALSRALDAFSDRQEWQSIMQRGMKMDFSWGKSANTYEDLYAKAVEYRRRDKGKG